MSKYDLWRHYEKAGFARLAPVSDGPIGELAKLSDEDVQYRCRERYLNLLERTGQVERAVKCLWADVTDRLYGQNVRRAA